MYLTLCFSRLFWLKHVIKVIQTKDSRHNLLVELVAIFGCNILTKYYCLPAKREITISTTNTILLFGEWSGHHAITIILLLPRCHLHRQAGRRCQPYALAKLPPQLPSWPPPLMPRSCQAAAIPVRLPHFRCRHRPNFHCHCSPCHCRCFRCQYHHCF